MDIRAIHTNEDYEWALKEIEHLMDAKPDTPDGDRLDILTTLVESYEIHHFPIEDPDPIEAIKFRMEEEGLKPKDLVPWIGQKSHIYEVLNKKRPLSLRMARSLHKRLKIPARIFLKDVG